MLRVYNHVFILEILFFLSSSSSFFFFYFFLFFIGGPNCIFIAFSLFILWVNRERFWI
jgi:hypothetical protein